MAENINVVAAMDHGLHNPAVTNQRKITCASQFALLFIGFTFGKAVHGGLEFPYYEAYNLFFCNLLQFAHSVTVSPQYRISKASRSGKSKATLFPDFALVRTTSRVDDVIFWRYVGRTVLAVVEIKPLCAAISSTFDIHDVQAALAPATRAARTQALKQVQYVFADNKDQIYVFAIVGAGPFWMYEVFKRSKATPACKLGQSEDQYILDEISDAITSIGYSPLQKLGSSASARQFIQMTGEMRERFEIGENDW